MGPSWQSPCTFGGTDKQDLGLFWSLQEGGDKTAWIWNRHVCPRVGSGGCESRCGRSRSVLSGTKGGQVHTLPHLEESGWFLRTVLPCNPRTTLAWEDPSLLPLTLAQPRGGAFRSLVERHSTEKHPHVGPERCCPLPAGPRGGDLSSDPQATWGFTTSIPALVWGQCRGGHTSL